MPGSQDRGLVGEIYLPRGFGDKFVRVSRGCARRHCSWKVNNSVSTSLNKVFWGVMGMYYSIIKNIFCGWVAITNKGCSETTCIY